MATATATRGQEIAGTILQQIKTADRWALAACGARDYVSFSGATLTTSQEGDQGGVMFRVTLQSARVHHKVIVSLTSWDEYRVTLIKVKRGSMEVVTEKEIDGVYFDNLAEVVYSICNK